MKNPEFEAAAPTELDGPRERLLFEENAEDSPQGFGRAPEQLVTDCECGEIRTAFFQGKLAQAPDRAMAWLKKAAAAGYKDVANLKNDNDLDAMRGRGDFQELMAGPPDG